MAGKKNAAVHHSNRGAQAKKSEKKYKRSGFDFTLLAIVLFLVGFGLVMIYSSSSYSSNAFFVKKQAMFACVGFAGMIFLAMTPYIFWRRLILLGYGATLFLSLVVLFIGTTSHGQSRWISISGFQFQPSEVAKLVLIMFLAHYMAKNSKLIETRDGLMFLLGASFLQIGLVAYANLSTGLIMTGITFFMLFIASRQTKLFFYIGLAGAGVMGLFLLFAGYRMERINAWLHVDTHEKAYQTRQALYAIGSGGIFGKGLGRSIQKLSYLPEAHNDMIFSVICEELGLFGAIAIIVLFMLLLWRCYAIACNANEKYGSFVVIGIMIQVGLQVFINIGVVTNSIPNTGIPLPFISYGGTSLIMLLLEMGMVLSVSRGIKAAKRRA